MQCKECDYSTAKQYNLKRHIQSKHPVDADGSMEIGNTSKSTEGDNATDSKAKLKDGCKAAMPNRFQCDFCEKSYVQKKHLNRHIKADHDKKSCICQHCGMVFSRTDTLSRQIKEIHVVDDLICPICDKSFDSI